MSKVVNTDTTLHINLDAVQNNFLTLQARLKSTECSAVVKANAYGLGAKEIAPALRDVGCKKFFVASLDEGIELRKILPWQEIYIIHGLFTNQVQELLNYNLIPVLNDLYQTELWNEAAIRLGRKLPAVLHIDTGMARLGMTHVTALHLFEKRELTKGLEIKFLMSHLSSPDDPSNLVNSRQLKRVKVIRKYALNIPFSLVSSSGIFLSEDYFFDLARPGMALYGLNPTPYTVNPMQNAVELTSKIIQIRNIYTRSSVGYGATYYAKKKQVLAVIAIGYSDGFFRSLSNKGECYIDGHIVPVVGRVSMDLVTLDVTNVPEYKLSPGVYVEVFGKNIPVESVAAKAGTSSYEILTSTRSNYQRVYSISEKAKYEFC